MGTDSVLRPLQTKAVGSSHGPCLLVTRVGSRYLRSPLSQDAPALTPCAYTRARDGGPPYGGRCVMSPHARCYRAGLGVTGMYGGVWVLWGVRGWVGMPEDPPLIHLLSPPCGAVASPALSSYCPSIPARRSPCPLAPALLS